jgi:hypothetical protein
MQAAPLQPHDEEKSMSIRYAVAGALVAATFAIAPVQAQEPAKKEEPSKGQEVKNWSLKQWNRARAEFAKDKAKWASCREQGKEQKLHGKASWEFLYTCMKS